MLESLTRNWGWVLLRGIMAILFGAVTLFYPGVTLAMLVLLFGAYALVDGIALVVTAVANRRGQPHWGAMLVGGLLGIAAGVVTFITPNVTAVALLAIIAAWAIIIGVAEIVAAIELRQVLTDEWMLGLAGVASVAFGVILVVRPKVGALAMALWIGGFAVAWGIMLCALAFRLRSLGHVQVPVGGRPQPA
ncbi:MAG TPA: HdeD family acid-resistance protein [Longimicrobiaceae bacterium]